MNARPDWADVAERSFRREEARIAREEEALEREREEWAVKISALFETAWRTGDREVMLPSVCGVGNRADIVWNTPITEACDDADQFSAAALRALTEWRLPGADKVRCEGEYRAAVEAYYIESHAADLARFSMEDEE